MPSGWAKVLIMYKIMQFGQRADDNSPKQSRLPQSRAGFKSFTLEQLSCPKATRSPSSH